MIRKTIHVADIHLRTYKHHYEYKEVFKTFIRKCRVLTEPYNYDEVRIVIAGDLFHQKITISNELLILVTWFLRKLQEVAPIVMIAGNHDALLNNNDRVDSITPIINLLPDLKISYFKESKCFLDDNIVWCVYSVFNDNAKPDIQSAKLEYGLDKTYIGLYHAPVLNARTDIGYEFDHGAGLDIFEDCQMVMMGDIHLRQSFNHNGIPIAFSSSLLQQNYGENISGHGFLFWDIEAKTFEEFDVPNDHGYYQFKIGSLNDLDENKEILTNL